MRSYSLIRVGRLNAVRRSRSGRGPRVGHPVGPSLAPTVRLILDMCLAAHAASWSSSQQRRRDSHAGLRYEPRVRNLVLAMNRSGHALPGHTEKTRDERGAVSIRYLDEVAMTLRLTDDELAALRERARLEGISMQEAARRAVRDYVAQGQHRDRVAAAAVRVMEAHKDALDRLGR
jgi:hypothetical protein